MNNFSIKYNVNVNNSSITNTSHYGKLQKTAIYDVLTISRSTNILSSSTNCLSSSDYKKTQ